MRQRLTSYKEYLELMAEIKKKGMRVWPIKHGTEHQKLIFHFLCDALGYGFQCYCWRYDSPVKVERIEVVAKFQFPIAFRELGKVIAETSEIVILGDRSIFKIDFEWSLTGLMEQDVRRFITKITKLTPNDLESVLKKLTVRIKSEYRVKGSGSGNRYYI